MARPGQIALRRKRVRERQERDTRAGSSLAGTSLAASSINGDRATPQVDDASYTPDHSAGRDDGSGDYDYEDAADGQNEEGEDYSRKKKSANERQVLPMANLPEDWDANSHEITDGAMYLAMINREASQLPFSTRAVNPYKQRSPTPRQPSPLPGMEPAGPSRHPALPRESWCILFPIHFLNYRKNVASRWPPSPIPPYPADYPQVPTRGFKSDWLSYINGAPRVRVPVRSTEEEEVSAEVELEDQPDEDDEDDEEAMMNAVLPPPVEMVLEDLAERHLPREPTLAILARLDTESLMGILSKIYRNLNGSINELSDGLQTLDPSRQTPCANPFTEHLAKWVFACLLVLDDFLSADHISTLRELGRVVMRIGGWRWIRGVTMGEVDKSWVFGARWKAADEAGAGKTGEIAMDVADGQEESAGQVGQEEESSIDATLARCWMVVYVIAHGWGQRDLAEELETLFR